MAGGSETLSFTREDADKLAQVDDLIRWQKAQNGSIQRIESRLWTVMITAGLSAVGILVNVILTLIKR